MFCQDISVSEVNFFAWNILTVMKMEPWGGGVMLLCHLNRILMMVACVTNWDPRAGVFVHFDWWRVERAPPPKIILLWILPATHAYNGRPWFINRLLSIIDFIDADQTFPALSPPLKGDVTREECYMQFAKFGQQSCSYLNRLQKLISLGLTVRHVTRHQFLTKHSCLKNRR